MRFFIPAMTKTKNSRNRAKTFFHNFCQVQKKQREEQVEEEEEKPLRTENNEKSVLFVPCNHRPNPPIKPINDLGMIAYEQVRRKIECFLVSVYV